MDKTCSLCKSLRPNGPKKFQNETEAQEHAQIHLEQMKLLDSALTVEHIYHQCFSRVPKVERDNVRSAKGRNQSLHDACRSIFGRRPKKPIAACNICGLGITITCGKKLLRTIAIIGHIRFHSKDKIFKCQYCSCSFSWKSGVEKHLIRSHQIEVPRKGDFDNQADMYQKEILIAIKRCFDQCTMQVDQTADVSYEFQAENTIRNKRNGSELAVERKLLCFRLIKKSIGTDGKIKCHLCSKRITAKNTNGLFTRCATDHAQFHLQKPVYGCKKCEATFVSHCSTAKHLEKNHNLRTAGNYDYFADNYHSALTTMISQCYDEETKRSPDAFLTKEAMSRSRAKRVIKTRTHGSSLAIERRIYCNDLIQRCADPSGKLVKCHLCSTETGVRNGHKFYCMGVLDHAALHLQKALYRCKICSKSYQSKAPLVSHLKQKHALGMKNNTESFEDKFHQEILNMLSECYEPKTEKPGERSVTTTKGVRHCMRGQQLARGCTKGSDLAAERNAFCNAIIRKNIDRGRKISCSLCTKRIGVNERNFQSAPVLDHVRRHLGKPFYRCLVCSATFVAYNTVSEHFGVKHGLKMKGNFESLEDGCHDEILAQLSKCFDGDQSGDV